MIVMTLCFPTEFRTFSKLDVKLTSNIVSIEKHADIGDMIPREDSSISRIATVVYESHSNQELKIASEAASSLIDVQYAH